MAAGDLITRDGQYEFKGLLLNNPMNDDNTIKVMSVEGLFDLPPFKGQERELHDDHGGGVGRTLLSMRRLIMQLEVLGTTKANLHTLIRSIVSVMQPDSVEQPLVFQRAFIGKMFVNARVSRFSGFPTGWTMERGRASAAVEFVCPDPRKLAIVQRAQQMLIPASGTTISDTFTMFGDFVGGAKPILEIAGPATNPRITNAGDGNRGIRIDVVVAAGQVLTINAIDRTVTLGGVDQSAAVRTDNQWWVLNPGNNLVTFTRSNSPASTAGLTIRWWDSYA